MKEDSFFVKNVHILDDDEKTYKTLDIVPELLEHITKVQSILDS